MSRHKPVSLRHKTPAARGEATTQTLAALGTRIVAIVCWIAAASLCVLAIRTVIENARAGAGLGHWEPAALMAGAIAALVVGARVWVFKRWACVAAVAGLGLWCLLDPWRPDHYRDAVVDPGTAIATSLVACVLFLAPLIAAVAIERRKLRPGF